MPTTTAGNSFAEGLRRALLGELDAIEEYTRLAANAPNRQLAERIGQIKNDEAAHARFFSDLLAAANPHSPYAIHQPQEFWAGVKHAYEDEVNTAAFYATLSLKAPDLATAAEIQAIAQDELRHACFFGTLLMSGK